jgi:hypothetical protein
MRTVTKDEAESLWSAYNSRFQAASKIGANKQGAGLEREMGLAYQKLVQAGLAPQIRKKYRGI